MFKRICVWCYDMFKCFIVVIVDARFPKNSPGPKA